MKINVGKYLSDLVPLYRKRYGNCVPIFGLRPYFKDIGYYNLGKLIYGHQTRAFRFS